MSVINQVLNQLEQRGVHTSSEQGAVRAVPHGKRKFAMPLLALGLALIAGFAAWQWMQTRKPVLSSAEGPNVQVVPKAAQGLALHGQSTDPQAESRWLSHTEGAGNSPDSNELEKLTPQYQPDVVAIAPTPGVLDEGHPAEMSAPKSGNPSPAGGWTELTPPASRLSFELSSVPLPSSLRAKPMQPVINSVSPNPVVVTGVSQPLVINGSNFAKNSTVTLRTSRGQVYAKRPVSSQNATQIVINPNLGRSPDTWTVEVTGSSGASSGLFAFTVQAPLVAAEQRAGQALSRVPPASGTPKLGNLLSAKAGAESTPPVGVSLPASRPSKGQASGGAPLTGLRSNPLDETNSHSTRLQTAAAKSPVVAGGSKAAVNTPAASGALPMKQVSNAQQADAEYRKAAALMQQGRITEALTGYEAALRLDAGHDQARQALVALLLEGKRGADAERVLQEGLKNKPAQTGFAMLLARLQVERGAMEQAMATLEKSLPYADAQADYHAFLAALLQRQNRHKEAITHYQIVLQLAPNNGIWQMGYGISLQALQRNAEAKEAYKRALDTQTLSPDLQAFVQQKLKAL